MFARILVVALAFAVAWAVFVHASEGAGPERTYVVRAGDTLWTIAARTYVGDPREGVWRIQERNRLEGTLIQPGERLVLP